MRQPLRTVFRPEYDVLLRLLSDARRESRTSQRELARRLGKTQSYVSKIESGQQRLDVLEFMDYARAIGAEPAMLMLKLDSLTRSA
ncbi:MAG: helix-turn-helix domain-containing protein [Fimbriimonadaceae bacterium]